MILVVVDAFTELVHLIACHDTVAAQGSAELLFANVFSQHGVHEVPVKLISDRDPRITSNVFRAIMRMLSTDHAMYLWTSTSHHPQTDGQVERVNMFTLYLYRVVEETLRRYVNIRQDDWDSLLPCVESAINDMSYENIQTSPFHVKYGFHPTLLV